MLNNKEGILLFKIIDEFIGTVSYIYIKYKTHIYTYKTYI